MNSERTNTLTLSILEEATAYNQWIFEQMKPYLIGNILEVGCGIGNLTGLLLNHGKVIVSDVNEDYLRVVGKKYGDHPNLKGLLLWDIEQGIVRNFDLSIHTILCSNVLEHIKKDGDAINTFFHLLPEGGRIILAVPALKRLYNVLDQELGHFRRYNRAELAQKLKQHGFEIRFLKYFNLFGILGWFINGTLLRRRLLSKRQVKLFNGMVPLFMQIEKIVPHWVGQSLIAVGDKVSKEKGVEAFHHYSSL